VELETRGWAKEACCLSWDITPRWMHRALRLKGFLAVIRNLVRSELLVKDIVKHTKLDIMGKQPSNLCLNLFGTLSAQNYRQDMSITV
jgi:hypothetical protein